MAHKCVVGGCLNRSDSIIHYILPEEPKRRRMWLTFIEGSNKTAQNIPESCRVCGEHFTQDNFIKFDLGFTTQFILNIDAVPSVYPRTLKQGIKKQATGAEKEVETCSITVTGTLSSASVKEEPAEYEVSHVTKPLDGSKSASRVNELKQQKNNRLLCAETLTEGKKLLRVTQQAGVNRGSGRGDLDEGSRDNKDKRFSCSTCGQKFRNKGVLMEHESSHIEDEVRTHRCQVCGKSFTVKAHLKAHQKLHAKSTVTHKCPFCPRQFSLMDSLNAHMRQHISQMMYKCPLCEDASDLKGELAQHIKTAHPGSRLVCSYCDKCFIRVNSFFKHIDMHYFEPDAMTYYCKTCKVYLLTKSSFQGHRKIHKETQLVRLNAQKGLSVDMGEDGQDKSAEFSNAEGQDSGMPLAPGFQDEPVDEPVVVQIENAEDCEMDPELVLYGVESLAEYEGTGPVEMVPEMEHSLPSPEELSYTDTSEDTDEME